MPRARSFHNLAVGAFAGLLATAPMTVVMVLFHRRLPWRQRYPLPPKLIVGDLAEAVGIEHVWSDKVKNATTAVSHFAYGACLGTPYAAFEGSLPGRPLAKGAGYGLLVWLANYLVGLPATGSSAAATREPLRRSGMMIVAHLIWGGCVGAIYAVGAKKKTRR